MNSHLPKRRFKAHFEPPCLLSDNSIPCMVFGEDALCLVFCVPNALFSLHIVVADGNIDQAIHTLIDSLPYVINPNKHIPNFNNPARSDPDETRAYPRSFFLCCVDENDLSYPSQIFIHPETDFHLDVRNYGRSTPVDMFPDVAFPENVRLPTQNAMVDSVINTTLDPKCDLLIEPVERELRIWLAYFVGYGIWVERKVLANGKLNFRAQALVDSVREENRPYLEACIRGEKGRVDSTEHRKRRSEIISRSGSKETAMPATS